MKAIFIPGTEVKAGFKVITGVEGDNIYVKFFKGNNLSGCNRLYTENNLQKYDEYYKYLKDLI